MNDAELLKRANFLHQEASRVLKDLNLFEIIGHISTPEVVGSAKNGMMIFPDIDIHAWMQEPDLETVAELLPTLAKIPSMQKVQFNNYREIRRDYRADRIDFPHAYYVGLRSMQPSGEWKIDMWFGARGDVGTYDESELDGITPEQKLAVIKLKEAWKDGNGYGDGVLSVDFYKAVMRENVKDEKGFVKYLETKN